MRRKITDVIERWNSSDQRKALLIKGPRQVGKTFSIEEFGKRVYGEHFLEINFKDNRMPRTSSREIWMSITSS